MIEVIWLATVVARAQLHHHSPVFCNMDYISHIIVRTDTGTGCQTKKSDVVFSQALLLYCYFTIYEAGVSLISGTRSAGANMT